MFLCDYKVSGIILLQKFLCTFFLIRRVTFRVAPNDAATTGNIGRTALS